MTDVSADRFDVICRLCTSSLVDGGAHEIFAADNADTPKSILRKITQCLQLKVLTPSIIARFVLYRSFRFSHYHAYTNMIELFLSIVYSAYTLEGVWKNTLGSRVSS
jgi:hypothetical protein